MSFRKWLGQLVSSNNLDEDRKRRELILNILLIFSIVCFLVINLIRVIDAVTRQNNTGLPLIITLAILAFFIFLFWLSKHGHSKIASLLLIITYSLPMFYSLGCGFAGSAPLSRFSYYSIWNFIRCGRGLYQHLPLHYFLLNPDLFTSS